MRRTISAAISGATSAATVLLTVAALTTGCGYLRKGPKTYEVILEVSGASAQKISYSMYSDETGKQFGEEVANPKLPWKASSVPGGGEVRLRVTPIGGPATCRIVVEKKEVAKKQGQPGTELTCTTTLDK